MFNTSFDGLPNWSPDGRRIAFQSFRDLPEEHPIDIYTMRATGRDQRRVTFNELPDLLPAWSPDGCKIAFHGFPDSTAEDQFANEDVFTINVDGSDQRQLTHDPPNDPRFDFAPDWQPLRDHHHGNDRNHAHAAREQADRSRCRR